MKKLIALLLALAMMIGLVACGAKEEAAAPAATEAAPAATEAAGEEAPAAAEEVTLTYWLPCNDLEAGAAECTGVIAVAKEFMKKYPNIKMELIPISGNSDESNAKVQMAAAANNLPDLLSFSFGYTSQWANTGVIMELSDIVAEISDNYVTDALESVNGVVDGYWSIPYTSECQGWAFNTEILDKYNLEVPETFDEFLNVCNVLVENGEKAISHGATDIWAIWGYHALFCQYGVDQAMCNRLSAGEEDFFTSEAYRKTLARIQEIAATGAYGDAVAVTSDAEAKAAFINGDAAMYNFATSFISELNASEHVDKFRYSYGPQFPDSLYDQTVGMRVYGWCNYVGSCVEKDPAKLEAVKLWLDYLTGEEGTQVLWAAGTIPATNMSVVDMSDQNPFMQSVFAALGDGNVKSVSDQCVAWYDASIKAPYRNAVTAMITGAADIDGAMQLLEDWQNTMS